MSGTVNVTVEFVGVSVTTATSLLSLLSGTAITSPTGGGGVVTTPPPVTGPTIPTGPALTMPTGITGNMPVVIGSGSGTIQIGMSYEGAVTTNLNFGVLVNGVAVAGTATSPLTLTTTTYLGGQAGQTFTISGNYGVNPVIQIVGVGNSLDPISFQSVSYNLVPYVTSTQTDSRGGVNVNATNTWVSNGATSLTWTSSNLITAAPPSGGTTTTPTGPTVPVPTNAASTITGATINGAVTPPATLQALINTAALAKAPITLKLPAGNFFGTASIPAGMTIVGAGPQLASPTATSAAATACTVISALGLAITNSKGIFVPQAAGVALQNLTLTQGWIGDSLGANGAAIRDGGSGYGCALTNVEISYCQNGILSAGSGNWNLTGCYIHDCGDGSSAAMGDSSTSEQGYTHNLYFNGVSGDASNRVSLTNVISIAGPWATHAFKSRAMFTTATGCTFSANPSSDPNQPIAGSCVDTPNGGLVSFTACTFIIPATAQNPIFYGYAVEGTGASNNAAVPAGATNVTMSKCVFTTASTAFAGIIYNGTTVPAAIIDVTGSSYTGTKAPTIQTFGKVIGTLAA